MFLKRKLLFLFENIRMKKNALLCLTLICFTLISVSLGASSSGVHECVHATRKLGKNGDGSTASSCMHCDPTFPDCYYDCQSLIDAMYVACDGVCLPQEYFFDVCK